MLLLRWSYDSHTWIARQSRCIGAPSKDREEIKMPMLCPGSGEDKRAYGLVATLSLALSSTFRIGEEMAG